MARIDPSTLDITKTNAAIDRLLARTDHPRHRYLLQAFARYRYLRIAGRYEEIFVPELMVEEPAIHVHAGGSTADLKGQSALKHLYRAWANINQTVFYVQDEQVAVADNFIASYVTVHQQMWGKALMLNKGLAALPDFISEKIVARMVDYQDLEADEHEMHLYTNLIEVITPFDDAGRILGQDVWEPDPSKATTTKLARPEVMSTREAEKRLRPLIQPLPAFDEDTMGVGAGRGSARRAESRAAFEDHDRRH
jgi:hypothetical protein